LTRIAERADVHPLLAGRLVRLLRDTGVLEPEEAARRLSLALSGTAGSTAAWVEGFLSGGGLLVVHDAALLELLDGWLTGLDDEGFLHALPLVRRTFSTFGTGERRQIGTALSRSTSRPVADLSIEDSSTARAALQTVARLMGVPS
jgi:hypothetical protein